MKIKNRVLILLLLLSMTFVMWGCGEKSNDPQDNSQTESEDTSAEVMAELSGKLQVGSAWQAVVAYGQTKYEKFEVRYMPGQPVEEIAQDADTWHLKAQCIVNGENMKCEAKVIGTTEVPEVIFFEVY